jgi:hypothetical protein
MLAEVIDEERMNWLNQGWGDAYEYDRRLLRHRYRYPEM